MKILSYLMILLILIIGSVYGQAINSEFRLDQDITQVKEGDVVEASMRFWPIENADLSQFRKLEKTLLFNSLYLIQINSLDVSPNNADVVELKGTFIVTAASIEPAHFIKYNDMSIGVKSGTLNIEKSSDVSQDFYILDQKLNQSYLKFIFLGLGLAILIFGIIKRKAIKDFVLNLKPDKKKKAIKKYDGLFRVASTREDFESLYRDKEIWLPLLESVSPSHREFLKILNQHQFKKDWGNDEFLEVRSSFDIIRRSFEK